MCSSGHDKILISTKPIGEATATADPVGFLLCRFLILQTHFNLGPAKLKTKENV